MSLGNPAQRETNVAKLGKIANEGHMKDDMEIGFKVWKTNWEEFLGFFNNRFKPSKTIDALLESLKKQFSEENKSSTIKKFKITEIVFDEIKLILEGIASERYVFDTNKGNLLTKAVARELYEENKIEINSDQKIWYLYFKNILNNKENGTLSSLLEVIQTESKLAKNNLPLPSAYENAGLVFNGGKKTRKYRNQKSKQRKSNRRKSKQRKSKHRKSK